MNEIVVYSNNSFEKYRQLPDAEKVELMIVNQFDVVVVVVFAAAAAAARCGFIVKLIFFHTSRR